MTTLYGIKNCDTIKKARRWLDDKQINYRFHDFRSDGLERQQVEQWIAELGWEALVNKRSTTWKTLADDAKQQMNNQTAVDAILQAPTLIKRPLLDTQQQRSVGFKASTYEALLLSPQ